MVSGVGCQTKVGFRCQVSGVSKKMTEGRKQFAFVCCHLFSVRCSLYLPDTRNLKPKIGPCFVNYLRDITLEAVS